MKCKYCNKAFQTNYSTKVYCTANCRRLAKAARESRAKLINCHYCKELFISSYYFKHYCGKECARKGHIEKVKKYNKTRVRNYHNGDFAAKTNKILENRWQELLTIANGLSNNNLSRLMYDIELKNPIL